MFARLSRMDGNMYQVLRAAAQPVPIERARVVGTPVQSCAPCSRPRFCTSFSSTMRFGLSDQDFADHHLRRGRGPAHGEPRFVLLGPEKIPTLRGVQQGIHWGPCSSHLPYTGPLRHVLLDPLRASRPLTWRHSTLTTAQNVLGDTFCPSCRARLSLNPTNASTAQPSLNQTSHRVGSSTETNGTDDQG